MFVSLICENKNCDQTQTCVSCQSYLFRILFVRRLLPTCRQWNQLILFQGRLPGSWKIYIKTLAKVLVVYVIVALLRWKDYFANIQKLIQTQQQHPRLQISNQRTLFITNFIFLCDKQYACLHHNYNSQIILKAH